MDEHKDLRALLRALGWEDVGYQLPSIYAWKMRQARAWPEIAALSERHPRGPGFAVNDYFHPRDGQIVPTGDYGRTLGEAARARLASLYAQASEQAADPKRDLWDVSTFARDVTKEVKALREVMMLDYHLRKDGEP